MNSIICFSNEATLASFCSILKYSFDALSCIDSISDASLWSSVICFILSFSIASSSLSNLMSLPTFPYIASSIKASRFSIFEKSFVKPLSSLALTEWRFSTTGYISIVICSLTPISMMNLFALSCLSQIDSSGSSLSLTRCKISLWRGFELLYMFIT